MGNCDKHEHCCDDGKRKKKQILISFAISITVSISVTFTILKLAVHPTNINFYLHELTLYQFNQTSPNTLTTTLHLSIHSRNPSSSFSLSYDSLRAYASYNSQIITLPIPLPPTFLGHQDNCLWSPFLYGPNVPVTPHLTATLPQEQAAGFSVIYVKIDGSLKWKLGMLLSGHSQVHVSCPVTVVYDGMDGSGSATVLQFSQPIRCSSSF